MLAQELGIGDCEGTRQESSECLQHSTDYRSSDVLAQALKSDVAFVEVGNLFYRNLISLFEFHALAIVKNLSCFLVDERDLKIDAYLDRGRAYCPRVTDTRERKIVHHRSREYRVGVIRVAGYTVFRA